MSATTLGDDADEPHGSPTHPASPRSSARGGARRFPPAVRAHLGPSVIRVDLEAMLRAGAGRVISQDAALVMHRGGAAHVRRLSDGPPQLAEVFKLWPVRRIGTYRQAPNRIGMYTREQAGFRVMLEVESGLELGHLRDLEFTRHPAWLLTQPFVIRWPVAGACAWRVPDILGVDEQGLFVADVKPEHAQTEFVRAMFELTRASLAEAGIRYQVLGGMTRQRALNLRALASQRWTNAGLVDQLAAARSARSRTLGGVIDSAGGHGAGSAAALHLLTRELSADLDRPLGYATAVTWGPR